MTLTIELTPEQESALEAEATSRGLELAEFAKLQLLEALPVGRTESDRTPADLLAQWKAEGCLGLFADRPEDSAEIARQLRGVGLETGVLIDTDVLIELQRETPAAQQWFASLTAVPRVAGFTAMELIAGCQDGRGLRTVERFLSSFPILWPSEAAMQHARMDFGALRLSHGIGLPDMLIAITAVEHGQELATFNGRHFRAVSGLIVVQPYLR